MNYQPDIIYATFKMIAALAVVIGSIFVLLFFLKRKTNMSQSLNPNKLIKILASRYIGVKKAITLVEVPGSILVLGVTNDRLTLLEKIDDEDTLMQYRQIEKSSSNETFSDRLTKIRTSLAGRKE